MMWEYTVKQNGDLGKYFYQYSSHTKMTEKSASLETYKIGPLMGEGGGFLMSHVRFKK